MVEAVLEVVAKMEVQTLQPSPTALRDKKAERKLATVRRTQVIQMICPALILILLAQVLVLTLL